MAQEFAPKLQPTDPNWTARSQGLPTDRRFETLFEGLGGALAGAASVYDEKIQRDIRTEAEEGFNRLNDDFGFVPDGATTGADGLPSEIVSTRDNLARLQRAREQGKLTDTAYYSRMTSQVKTLKSRFPGYAEQVDQIIQEVTGTRPANALRNAMLSELSAQEAERSQAQQDRDQFIKSNQDILGIIEPGIFTNRDAYSDAQINELQGRVAQVQGEYYKGQVQLQNLNIDSANHSANSRRAESLATSTSNNYVNQALAGLGNVLELPGGANIYDTMRKAASGEIQLDPDEIQQLKGGVTALRSQLAQKLRTDLTQNGADILGADKINTIVNSSLATFDQISSFLDSGDYDLAGMAARSTQTMVERDGWNLLSQNETARQIKALEVLPPEVREHIATQSGLYSRISTDLSAPVIAGIISGENNLGTVLNSLEGNANLTAADKNGVARLTLDNIELSLTSPETDMTQLKNIVSNVYTLNPAEGQSIFDLTEDSDQMTVYRRLTSPEITKSIMDSGDRALQAQYYNWATTQFSRMTAFRNMAQDVSTLNNTRDFMSATLNEKGEIVAQVDQEAFDAWAESATPQQRAVMANTIKKAQKGVDTLNGAFANLRPIIEGVGSDPSQAMGNILMSNFIDLDAREDSWGMWIADQMSNLPDLTAPLGGTEAPEDRAVEDLSSFMNKAPQWLRSNMRSETFLNDQEYLGMARSDSAMGRAIQARQQEDRQAKLNEEIDFLMSDGENVVEQAKVALQSNTKSAHTDPNVKQILDMIGTAEGAGYDDVYGYNQRRYGWTPTQMTIGEVKAAQRQLAKDTGSSAFGKYQIIQGTLRDAINALNIPDDAVFDEELQDRIATEFLLRRRGFDRWVEGKMDNRTFLNNLAQEWASIPTTGGQSFYAGDAIGNKASRGGQAIASMINR